MLAADKLQLQSALKQQATALKEKEFQLHHSNLMTVGTQAAVLASLDVTMFIEFQPPHDSEWGDAMGGHAYLIPRTLKFVYYCMITTAFCCNILVVAETTLLSVLGTALALRGPDGSMITATDGMYNERKTVFYAFGVGLATTIGSAVSCVWLILSPEAALICMSITVVTCFKLYQSYLRMTRHFAFDESQTVDFSDIFEGPAAIKVVRSAASATSSRHGFSDADDSSLDDMVNGYLYPSESPRRGRTSRNLGTSRARRPPRRVESNMEKRRPNYMDDGNAPTSSRRRRGGSVSPLLTV